MRKGFLKIMPALLLGSVSALDNSQFQKFDNQYNIGFSMSQTDFANGFQQHTLEQDQYLTLDAERLFDIGIWVNANIYTNINVNSLGNQANGSGQGAGFITTQAFNEAGLNFKTGYAFTLLNQHLQLIPYATIGQNANLAQSVIQSNSYNHTTNDWFYTGGAGGRIEYRINDSILVFADQDNVYNWDQSGPIAGVQPQNNMIFTSTLGAKFNIVKNLQLGLNGFYNNYQYLASVPPATVLGPNGGNRNGSLATIYQPQSSLGGLFSVGLTY